MTSVDRSTRYTVGAPCGACGLRAIAHDRNGQADGCPGYQPVPCGGAGPHVGPVRVLPDDRERCAGCATTASR